MTPPRPTPTPDPTPQPTPPTPTPTPGSNQTGQNNKTISTKTGPIVEQAILVKDDMLYINMYFQDPINEDLNVTVNLIDKEGNKVPVVSKGNIDKTTNKVYFTAQLPEGHDLATYSLVQTSATGKNINSTIISAQPS